MQRFPFQSWLNYNPLLPASDKWSTPLNSPHHDDFKKVWFVGCLTTARATPASREGARLFDAQLRSVFDQVKIFPNDPKSLGHLVIGPNLSKIYNDKLQLATSLYLGSNLICLIMDHCTLLTRVIKSPKLIF